MSVSSMPARLGFDGGTAGYNQMMGSIAGSARQFAAGMVSSSENTFYQAMRKTQNFCDIASLVVGDYGRSQVINTYQQTVSAGNSEYLHSLTQTVVPQFDLQTVRTDPKTGMGHTETQNFKADDLTAKQLNELRINGSTMYGGAKYTAVSQDNLNKSLGSYDSHFDYHSKLTGAVSKNDQFSAMQTLYRSATNRISNNENLNSLTKAINSGKGTEHVRREAAKLDKELTRRISELSAMGTNDLTKQLATLERSGERLSNNSMNLLFEKIERQSHLTNAEKMFLKKLVEARNEARNFVESGLVEGCRIGQTRNAQHAGRNIIMRNLMGQDLYQFYSMTRAGVRIGKGAGHIVRTLHTKGQIKRIDRLMKISPLADMATQDLYNRMNGFAKGTHSSHVTNTLARKKEQLLDQKQFVDSLRNKTFSERKALKRGRKESILDAKNSDRLKRLRERRERAVKRGNTKRATKLDKQTAALKKRQERRFVKRKKRRDRLTGWNSIKSKFRTVGRKLAAPFKAIAKPFQKLLNVPRAILNKIITAILLPIAQIILIYMVGIPVGVLLVVYFLYSFISNIIPNVKDMSKKWAADRVRQLNDQNYFQYIVDTAGDDIANDFFEICNKEGYDHFSKKDKQISQDIAKHDKTDIDFKNNITTKWYAGVNYGEIGHIWVWEEADELSTFDETTSAHKKGDKIFKKGFIDSDDYPGYLTIYERTAQNRSIDNVNANMVPILSMLKQRYIGDINFETYPTALGYFYYMYAMSHDISRYDTSIMPKGSAKEVVTSDDVHYTEKDKDELGFGYRIDEPCPRNELYSAELSWDPGSHSVIGRENELCTNIYIHSDATSLSKKHLDKGLGIHLFQTNEVALQKTIQQNFPNKHNGSTGWWIIDDSLPPSEVTASKQASFTPGGGEHSAGTLTGIPGGTCTHVGIGMYDAKCTKCGCVEHTQHGPECYQSIMIDKDHDGINETDTGTTELRCPYAQENGGPNPGDGLHTHKWNDADGGCYVRVAYCKGHCGGHITPVADIVQTMTYQGLARLDDFKTTHFLTVKEVLGKDITSVLNLTDAIRKRFMADADSRFATVNKWRYYWYSESVKWYTPFPRSIWGLGTTLWNKALKFLAEAPSEDDLNKEKDKKDVEKFTGWHNEETREMDKNWVSTLDNYYGSFYKPNEFKTSDGKMHGDEKYVLAQKMWDEPIMAKDWAVKFPKINITSGSIGGYNGNVPGTPFGFIPGQSGGGGGSSTITGTPLSEAEIQQIIAQIRSKHGGDLTATREEMIRFALSWVGNIGYKQSRHTSELTKGGFTDCSGFATHVYNQFNPGFCPPGTHTYTSSTLHNMGTPSWNGIKPGDILSKNGHAVVFLWGDGDSVYTVESTSDDGKEGPGGVRYRKRSMRQMQAQGYNLVKFN